MSNPAAEVGSPAAGGLKKGPWTAGEDAILVDYVKKYGEGNWNAVQRNTGLSRCGKSCRLRWANHLRPNLKKGSFSPDEERLILELHSKMGNKWARMAAQAWSKFSSSSSSELTFALIFIITIGLIAQLFFLQSSSSSSSSASSWSSS